MQLRPNRLALQGLFALALLSRLVVASEEGSPSEYQVEAAFLYHFAQFVIWPSEVFATTNAPLKVGFVGDDPVCGAFETAVTGKTVNGHPFQILRLDPRSPAECRPCQIVFIAPMERKRLGDILAPLKGASILTVSRTEHFTESGGMVNFILEQKKVRFEINDVAARAVGLKVSAKLLNLARRKDL